MEVFDRGSPVRIQSEHKSTSPFVTTEDLYNPTTVTVTVTDANGVDKVIDQESTNHATGQYYYIAQTLDTWDVGVYTVTTTATGPTYNDVQTCSFGLK